MFVVVYIGSALRVAVAKFTNVDEAIDYAAKLPVEADTHVLGVCSKHGVADYDYGYCEDCCEESYVKHLY